MAYRLATTVTSADRQTTTRVGRAEPRTIAVLTVSQKSLAHPPSSRVLKRMAAEHELILVGDHDVALGLVRTVRALLPRHRVVALLVDATLLRHERELLDAILNDGHLPVVLTAGEPSAAQLSHWLNTDTGRFTP
jgi:hypothetical protein